MLSVVANLITPAFVASIVSIFFNIRSEKLKTYREHVVSSFQEGRTAVSAAVSAAADYFTTPGAQRTPGTQTRLFICEREVRCALAVVCEAGPKFDPPMDVHRVEELADALIDALTGDTFGSVDCPPSPQHAQSIATIGADLRDELVRARERQLNAWVGADLFQRFLLFVRRPMGPLHYKA